MKKLPTDLEILEEIYRRYYLEFSSFSKEAPNRTTKIYIPIDIESIARHFRIDLDIIFGRLYYHLEPKYSFIQTDGAKVHFFVLKLNSEIHNINFPLLASVLASLKEEQIKYRVSTWLSIFAIGISIASLVISFVIR